MTIFASPITIDRDDPTFLGDDQRDEVSNGRIARLWDGTIGGVHACMVSLLDSHLDIESQLSLALGRDFSRSWSSKAAAGHARMVRLTASEEGCLVFALVVIFGRLRQDADERAEDRLTARQMDRALNGDGLYLVGEGA